MEILLKLINFIVISIVIQFSIAFVLIMTGKGKTSAQAKNKLNFDELFLDYSNLPKLQAFVTRDGKKLAYRHYPAQSEKVIILLHGSGWHSQIYEDTGLSLKIGVM